jgi:hypothetical protein
MGLAVRNAHSDQVDDNRVWNIPQFQESAREAGSNRFLTNIAGSNGADGPDCLIKMGQGFEE